MRPDPTVNESTGKPVFLAVAWSGLPPYTADCLRELSECYPGQLAILGFRPSVPHAGIEDRIGQKVIWLERGCRSDWQELGLPVPDHFLQTGWAHPEFNHLGAAVREAGGKQYAMIDNIWVGSARQWLGRLVYRLRYRRWFDSVLVPGRESTRLCRLLGIRDDSIFQGQYGADPRRFKPGEALGQRPKRILFVGQLIGRKGVPTLLEAAREARARGLKWEFLLVGAGALEEEVRASPDVEFEAFGTPERVAALMRESRFLVLPSLDEHWGVVVHEAALSGCGLLLSERVGAAADLLGEENGLLVPPSDPKALLQAFENVARWDSPHLEACQAESLRLSAKFGPSAFTTSVRRMIGDLS